MNKKIGNLGEGISRSYLEEKGYEILKVNFRTRLGEIDIIASINDILVFVEVKTRQSVQFGLPRESVNFKKQQTYYRLAEQFLQYHTKEYESYRFDVVEVYISGEQYKIKQIENAF